MDDNVKVSKIAVAWNYATSEINCFRTGTSFTDLTKIGVAFTTLSAWWSQLKMLLV